MRDYREINNIKMADPFAAEKGAPIRNVKVTSFDSIDGLCCYGDSDGSIYLSQLETSEEILVIQEIHNKRVSLIEDALIDFEEEDR